MQLSTVTCLELLDAWKYKHKFNHMLLLIIFLTS
uniref:Uncharacterized protein n=1 Tax=Anguilla anguilla TaxID=7936 RepID=A0A0E9QX90_ANGAN